MLTAIQIITDRQEYSRFEPNRSKMRVRVVPTPNTGLIQEAVSITIHKTNGAEIFSVPLTLDGDLTKGLVTEIDLHSIVDGDGTPICTRGEYTIKASQGELTASATFRVALITVDEMRQTYCFGAPLYASERKTPKKQPTAVTGVSITFVSENTRNGLHNLIYSQTANTLAWGDGPAVTLDSAHEILPDKKGGYIEVDIDSFDIPAQDASEAILIDREYMTDDALRSKIEAAINTVENSTLKVFVEPYRIATEPFFSNPEPGKWYDRKAPELAYYRNDFNKGALAWRLSLPVTQLLKIDNIQGYMGNTMAMEIGAGALTVNTKAATVDVLPYDSQYAFLYTFFVQLSLWGNREYIAGFWRYSGKAGIEVPDKAVIQAIAYRAAISILTVAGQAYRGGITNESTSKDGVSTSRGYNAANGIYAATIKEYGDWLDKNEPDLRKVYRGISMVTI